MGIDVNRNSLPSGATSGVDADTLDGLEAAVFSQIPGSFSALPAGVNTSDVPDAWPTDGVYMYVVTSGAIYNLAESGILILWARQSRRMQIFASDTNLVLKSRQAKAGAYVWSAWGTVVDSAHSGSGSGYDSDTVDGKHAADFLLSADYTGSSILAKLITQDGAASGLDADKLDGLESTAFVQTSAYTNAALKVKVLAIDGAGSGLDADFLDGLDSTGFFRQGTDTAATSVNWKISDTGAQCIRLKNKTGAASVAGTLVEMKSDINYPDSVIALRTGSWRFLGVVVDAGVADGSYMWVAISGKVLIRVRPTDAVTPGDVLRTPMVSGTAGVACNYTGNGSDLPSAVFAIASSATVVNGGNNCCYAVIVPFSTV